MPTCRYHPLEPADRVCAPCLASKLNSLSRKEGGIRRFVDSFHSSAYPDEEDWPIFSLHGFGVELEKKAGSGNGGGGITIPTALVRAESHRESAGSANAFYSCASEMSNRLSVDTHSEVDIKSAAAATPSRKSDSRRYKVEQANVNFTDYGSGNETSIPPAVAFNPPPSYPVQSTHSFPPSDIHILPGPHHNPHHHHHHQQQQQQHQPQQQQHHHHHQLGAFSDRLCISDLITQSMREADIKYRKPCSFSQNLLKRRELKDPSHSHGICLKTPIWKFKLFSKSSPIWRLGLKGSNKVSPSKREVDMETRGSHNKRAAAGGGGGATTRHSNTTSRRLIASPPDDSVRIWCPSPMVTFKEGSFRWGKTFDRGSASGRKTVRDDPDGSSSTHADNEQQSATSTSTSTGVFRRLFDLAQRRGGNSANRSETESTSSCHTGHTRAHEIPPRTQYDEEQAQLAANILSWMDGAAATAAQLDEPPSTCSTMAAKTGDMPRIPEPDLAVR